jgi:hypothetical protein
MRRAQRCKFHFIYKTTCVVTDRFYIGMHSTDNMNDGYLGSGKWLKYSIKKHGCKSHQREIIEMCETRETLRKREEELINDDLLKDEMCMNLDKGGGGGWSYCNKMGGGIRGCKSSARLENPVFHEHLSAALKQRHAAGTMYLPTFLGRTHQQETKNKIGRTNSIRQQGKQNSQFGTVWIFNSVEQRTVKIKRDQLDIYLKQGWVRGRKVIFRGSSEVFIPKGG